MLTSSRKRTTLVSVSILTLLLFFISQASATPTVFELYRDITPGAVQARPSNFAVFNGVLYFEAANAADNDEPFKFDGTTLTQITNGAPLAGNDSNLTNQFVFNNRLYAVMESNVGRELFEYNAGTNTYNVHTNLNGANDGFPRPMLDVNGDTIVFGGHLLMEGDPDGLGDRFYLLRSDNNTLQLLAGATKRDPSNVAVFGGNLYYEADDGAGNDEPFRLVAGVESQITNGAPLAGNDSNLTDQFVFNNRLYAVMESNVGRELFEYNAGTNTYNIHTNLNGANDGFPRPMNDINGDAVIFNGHLLMEGDPDGLGDRFYLLRSDNNTLQLLAGATKRDPSNVALFNGDLYYEADDGAGNDEPFKLVAGVETQIPNNSPLAGNDSNLTSQFTYLGDLYAVMESNNGRELYKFNAGTSVYERMIDLNGAGDSFPIHAKDVDGTVIIYQNAMIFRASDTNLDGELFRLRGLAVPPDISIADASLTEGNAGTSNLNFTVTRSNNTSDVNVNFATANATATAGSDYVATSGTLAFTTGGALTQNVTVVINGDTTVELNETFQVNLSNPTNGATITDAQAIGTINNNDSASITINDVNVAEGNAGTVLMSFSVNLSAAVDTNVSVNVATADNTATSVSGDYLTSNGTLTFTAGTTSSSTSVSVNGDSLVELNETFFVNLSGLAASGRNVTIADNQGVGTINNDDSASLSIADVNMSEGDVGTTAFNFTVTLNNAVDTGITIDAISQDGTATTAANDYVANNTALNFTGTAGETQNFTVNVNGDTIVESNENFSAILSGLNAAGRNVSIADNTGVATIINDDSTSLTINDVSITEGNAGTSNLVFGVTVVGAVKSGFSVDYATADNTATAGTDFINTSGTLNFAGIPNETQNVTITINGDGLVELDESFFVNLSNVTSPDVTLADAQGVGTITNDDSASLTIADVSQNEGDVGATTFTFVVTLDNPVDTAITVDAASADGTATAAGNDYVANNSTLNFAGNVGETQSFVVDVNGDSVVESNEDFSAILSGLNAAGRNVVIADNTAIGTILNDDSASVSINDVSVTEGDAGTTNLVFDVTLTGSTKSGFSVDYASVDGSAIAGTDYTTTSGTLNFSGTPNETQTITVIITGDTMVELDESFVINLSNINVLDVTIADAQGTGTITNDDTATISIADVSAVEGDAGSSLFVFDVTLSGNVDIALSMDANTVDGSATVAANDYLANNSQLNFSGAASEIQTFAVTVNGDTAVESNEDFTVVLNNLVTSGRDVTFADDTGLGTILNDDSTSISITDAVLVEGNAGSTNIEFTVQLGGLVKSPVTIDFTTADGTALAGSDYIASNGTLNFVGNPGEIQTISIPVNGDNLVELDETFVVNLSNANPPEVTISDGQGIGTINNDDAAELTINNVSTNEGPAGLLDFTITLSQAVDIGIQVDYGSQDGTATTVDNDYNAQSGTLNFAGVAGETQQVSISVNDDMIYETDETMHVVLSNLITNNRNVSLINNIGTGTIINDDPEITATKTATVNGEVGYNSVISYQVTLSHNGATALNVQFTDQPDPAVELVVGSVTTTTGTITSGNNVGDSLIVIELGDLLTPSNTVVITYDVIINSRVNRGDVINNQGFITGDNFNDTPTDDPTTPQALDATRVIVGVVLPVPTLAIWSLLTLILLTLMLVSRHFHRYR
ncbi:MAG: hypothetical protein KDI92_07345 [Xanthomonadales bacterium]|nr:hypothetical protein [Xanthomonadales bacterium]